MRILNATKLDGVHSTTPFKGALALREVHLWPAWCSKSKNDSLFSYEYKNQRVRVLIENKTYTFDAIQKLIKKHLDVVTISHRDRRVTLTVKDPLLKIQLCGELLDVLKLPKKDSYSGTISGDPVDLSKIELTFNDCKLVYLRCDEIEKTNILENSVNSNLMAVVPLEENQNFISYRDPNPLFHPLTKKKMVYNIHFSMQDSQGNNLPFQKFILTMLNKDELL